MTARIYKESRRRRPRLPSMDVSAPQCRRPRRCPPSPLRQNLVWACILLAHCAPARPAVPDPVPPLDVARAEEPPRIDGRLDEPLWQRATRVEAFLARYPIEGAAPSRRTEVLLAYTEHALYLAVRAMEPEPEAIRATALRRDDFAITRDDQFALAIDSFRDRRNGYWFSTNPLGVRVDAQFADEGERFEDNWNGVWDTAASTCDGGWCAELEIPWATLRFPAGPEVVMGINLFRRIPHTDEQLFAPLIPLSFAEGTPSVSIAPGYRFRGISGGARLDLRPFAVGSFAGDGSGSDGGGLFVRYPLSDALTLSATVNADFSEVEVDDAQLNLTRFPLFLPEKRDFFLENAGTFTAGVPGEIELFFPRVIGLIETPAGDVATVPLDWGLKATGHSGRLELGLLAVATGSADAVPGEQFNVARAKYALGSRSFVGGLWSRREGGGLAHQTTAVDFSHHFARQVRLQGFAARDEQGGAGSDAWFASLSRAGERLAFELSLLELGRGFQPAVGLAARPGHRRLAAGLTLPWFPGPQCAVRRFAPQLELRRWEALDGTEYDETIALGFDVEWKGGRRLDTELLHQRERLAAPFALYREHVVPAGDYTRWEAGATLASDPTRPLAWEAGLAAGGRYGGRHLSGNFGLSWRPGHRLVVAPLLLADRIELDDAAFTATVAQLRIGITPTARLRLDLLGQYESEQRATRVGLRARYDWREGTNLIVAWDAEERGTLKLNWLVRW
ncbi:MAG: hypothetical protein EPO25_11965 [Gammaproteobacteria bacterium]|nr:MAG: hypothetical protein EPO25_11965 [Gammaproteobacteria bacterium]